MRCSNCDRENPDDARFCVACGNTFTVSCKKCGAENPPDANFCRQCGAQLAKREPAVARATQPHPGIATREPGTVLEGERKTITALFADIKGSTELEQDIDPEQARAIVDPALKLMIEAVQRYDGYVVQSTGDGIFALFGAPVAHEDHPLRALYAALRMQEDLRRYSSKPGAEGGNPLQCRVGVNTGEVVVRSISIGGKTEYTPIGHTANLASRMQAVAPVGSIAVAESTANCARAISR
jgi:class 3 adenylate cyclase